MGLAGDILVTLCIAAEHLIFFYTIYRVKPRRHFGRREWLLVLLMAVFLFVHFIPTGVFWGAELAGHGMAFLAALALYELSVRDGLRLFLFSFFTLSLLTETEQFWTHYLWGVRTDATFLGLNALNGLLLWGYYLLLGRRLPRNALVLDRKTGAPFIWILLLESFTVTFFQHIMSYDEMSNDLMQNIGSILAGVGGFLIPILLLVLLYHINTARDYRARADIAELYKEQQRAYYSLLLEKEQNTRRLRHDYQSDMVILGEYLEREEYGKLAEYLVQMQGALRAVMRGNYTVGNEVADVILNHYLRDLDGIAQVTVAGHLGEHPKIAERDLCVLISNLVRNAVEELLESGMEKKEFLMEIRSSGEEIAIWTWNTCRPRKEKTPNSHSLPQSTKGEGHLGIGLLNVREIAERYGGSFLWRVRDGAFETDTRFLT